MKNGWLIAASHFYLTTWFPNNNPEAVKQSSADYLDYLSTRLTVVGAAYLSVVCVIPELLIAKLGVPFYLGGTSLLIVVNVTLDTVNQIHSHMMAHQYEGLIKKSRLRGRKR